MKKYMKVAEASAIDFTYSQNVMNNGTKEGDMALLLLSEDLKYWRAERPDEWTMDRFIRAAEKLERSTIHNKDYAELEEKLKSLGELNVK